MARKSVPEIVLVSEGSEQMTTDVALDQFDFGEWTEEELDKVVEAMAVGEEKGIECVSLEPKARWTITIRRVV